MNRLCLALSLLLGSVAYGQNGSAITLYIHDTTGQAADTPLLPLYQLASTAVGGYSNLVVKAVNTSVNPVYFVGPFMSSSATSLVTSLDFSITGVLNNQTLAPGRSELFTVNFTPSVAGVIIGYLNLAYQVEQNGCALSATSNVCPAYVLNVSTMTGTATPAVLTLSYQTANGPIAVTPFSGSPINFPDTAECSVSMTTFTLTNPGTQSVTVPAISVSGSFSVDTSTLPAQIAGGKSADFLVTFVPSQIAFAVGQLQIGSNSYGIQGQGTGAFAITYSGIPAIVTTIAQFGTPIIFPQVLPGNGASSVLQFTISNPSTAAYSITIPTITISGSDFSLSGLPTLPAVIAPGSAATFTVAFRPSSSGSETGTLSIGCLTFSISGLGVTTLLPTFSITTATSVASQQQQSLIVQLGAPSPVSALGTLTLHFTPSIANAADDSAIVFTATNGRQLNISVASGAQTATYNSQSSITFQTGTTGGILTFSVAFPDTPIYTQSFAIPSAAPAFTVQANRETPNLLVTLDGFDNTYSAGVVSFTFYDTGGSVIGSPISFNATSDFQQLFFTGNTYGGLFSLQASFPVSGDVTKVGSVTVGLANSLGQTTGSASFQ